MSKKGLIAIVVVGVLGGVGAGGYWFVQTKIEDEVQSTLAAYKDALPPNTTVEYDSLSINPLGLSVTIKGLRLDDPVEHVVGTVKKVTFSNPSFSGFDVKTVDLESEGVEFSSVESQTSPAMTAKIGHIKEEDLDLQQEIALTKMVKGLKSIADLEPEALSRINGGPIQVRNLDIMISSTDSRASLGDTHTTVGAIDIDGVKGGVYGRVTLTDWVSENNKGTGMSLESFAFEGVDAVRAVRWLKDTEARMARGEPPMADSLGLSMLDVKGFRVKSEGHTLAMDHMAFSNLENAGGLPVRQSLKLEGLHIPARALDGKIGPFLFANGQSDLVVGLTYAQAWNQETKSLAIGPVTLDLGVLGQYSSSLDLSSVEADMFSDVQKNPDRLLEYILDHARLESVTAKVVAGSGTASFMDRMLAEEGISRADLATQVYLVAGKELNQTLGAEFGDRLASALSGFITAPGTLTLSAKAKGPSMSLKQFSMGLALVPQRVLQDYNVQVDYVK